MNIIYIVITVIATLVLLAFAIDAIFFLQPGPGVLGIEPGGN